LKVPPARAYAIIANYREHHPNILPKRYFSGLEVEAGGVGEGTVFRAEMSAAGRKRAFRGVVTEPEPGRVIVETYPESGTVTTFTVDPDRDAGSATVTIATEWTTRGGLLGMVESTLTAGYLRRVFTQELARLESYAAGA
jgi:hypothetical protein